MEKIQSSRWDQTHLHRYYYDLIMSNIAEISHKYIRSKAIFDFFINVDKISSGIKEINNSLINFYIYEECIPIKEVMIELHALCTSVYSVGGIHHDTIEHLSNVRKYTNYICSFLKTDSRYRLFLDNQAVELISMGALLHDVSKIIIDDKFLYDGRKYTAEERTCINTHPLISSIMIEYMAVNNLHLKKSLDEIGLFALQHHENVNGSGYPIGLVAKEISLGGLIIRVADSYDALIASNRIYKKPFSTEEAIEEIASKVDVMYDRNVAEALFAYIDTSSEFDNKVLSKVPSVEETV